MKTAGAISGETSVLPDRRGPRALVDFCDTDRVYVDFLRHNHTAPNSAATSRDSVPGSCAGVTGVARKPCTLEPAGEQELLCLEATSFDPPRDRFAGLLGDLELYGPPGLLLHHDGPCRDSLAVCYVPYPQSHQVACPKLAVDGQVK